MLFQLLLFLLAPIAVYCLFLATLNRRLRPVLVRGHWDFVGLLFATSGFFLVVVPGLLVSFYHRSLRQVAVAGGAPTIQGAISDLWAEWWWAWLLYYFLLVAGSVLLLLWRRQKTSIYNIAPADFDRALAKVMEQRGLEASRIARQWIVREKVDDIPIAELTDSSSSPVGLTATRSRGAIFDLEAFPSMCHVTLHWREHDASLRDEIEMALGNRLQEVATFENPAAGWFLGISGFLFGLLFLIVLVMILSEMFPARR